MHRCKENQGKKLPQIELSAKTSGKILFPYQNLLFKLCKGPLKLKPLQKSLKFVIQEQRSRHPKKPYISSFSHYRHNFLTTLSIGILLKQLKFQPRHCVFFSFCYEKDSVFTKEIHNNFSKKSFKSVDVQYCWSQ